MKRIDFKFLKGSDFWDEYWQSVRNLGYTQQDIEDYINGKSKLNNQHRAALVFLKRRLMIKKNN